MSRQAITKVATGAGEFASGEFEMRIDPAALPVRFTYAVGHEPLADQAIVVLDRERARVRRRLPSGIPLVLQVAIGAFEGVAIRFEPSASYSPDGLRAVLELRHADRQLSIPLAVATDVRDLMADWRAWGRMLSLPLLMTESDESLTIVEDRLGAVEIAPVKPRRRRSVLALRRPRFLVRRRPGVIPDVPEIVTGDEISAWD